VYREQKKNSIPRTTAVAAGEGGIRPAGGTEEGAAFGGAKIWNSKS